MHTLGLIVGFFTCYGTTNIPSSLSWRLPFAILSAYQFAFTVMALLVLPESPRWLTFQGREKEAGIVWEKLQLDPSDREKIIHQQSDSSDDMSTNSHEQEKSTQDNASLGSGTEAAQGLPNKQRQTTILEAFSSPETRPQLLAALFLMGMQQLSGIDGVLFVSIFKLYMMLAMF